MAPWTGMGWTLNAGGVVTRTVRGIPDFGTYWPNQYPIPYGFSTWCRNQNDNADPTNYYRYIQDVLSGLKDSQPDLFSFNVQGYSGKIVFDQQGQPFTIPAQPLRIQAPSPATQQAWVLTTPDGTQYTFAADEWTFSNGFVGQTAWYLTKIVSPQQEQVDFAYGDYTSEIAYPRADGYQAVSTQTAYVGDPRCGECPNTLNLGDRPGTRVNGKYLRRISSATHRIDLLSSANRSDEPGLRQLNVLRLKSVADSSRFLEYRLRYDSTYPSRLFLKEVQKVGVTAGQPDVLEPAHVFAYNLLWAPPRGTYDVDRWGYYNAAGNQYPFPKWTGPNPQPLPPANRDTHPTYVTFGLLQRVGYPTGGHTEFEFEPHDFSNVAGPLHQDTPQTRDVCAQANGPGTPPDGVGCNGQPTQETTFEIPFSQTVSFAFAVDNSMSPGQEPVSELHASLRLYPEGSTAIVDEIAYPQQLPNLTALRSLPAGRYRAVLRVDEARTLSAHVTIAFTARTVLSTLKQIGGGTRIKRIITRDGVDAARDQVKEYYYDNDRHTRSTGRLIHQPVFHSPTAYMVVKTTSEAQPNTCFSGLGEETLCRYVVHSAEDVASGNGSAQGSAVGYDTVTVIQRHRGTSLRTTSVFRNEGAASVDLSDSHVADQGFVSAAFDEQNGQLLQTLEYAVRENGDPFNPLDIRLVRRTAHQYGSPLVKETYIRGLSIAGAFGDLQEGSQEPCRTILAQSYETRVGWWPLTRTDETRYDGQGRSQTTTTKLVYENPAHLQPARREVTDASGRVQVTRFKYAPDYAANVDPGLTQLQDKFMVSLPVEEQQWVHSISQAPQWLGGKVTRYAPSATAGPLPSRVYVAALSRPAAAPASENKDASGRLFTSLLPDPQAYQARAEFFYSSLGQLQRQALTGDVPTAYLWGEGGLRPIAEVKFATEAQIAYTSFEPGSAGGWSFGGADGQFNPRLLSTSAITGQRSYRLDGGWGVRRDNLPPGDYELTFYAKGGRGNNIAVFTDQELKWTESPLNAKGFALVRSRIRITQGTPAIPTGSVNIEAYGRAIEIDEVRLHPVSAQMTSLTYDGLGGVTSRTDPANRMVTYEYDALGRLLLARDEQGRIVSQHEYRYFQP
ncbi:RHS repeat domain-containing protein [Solirubrum puertoriconensis]|uniref:RHS repeat domain-containing protein n=1 Tax=Solirubrum puertoriconensis TaxID=1751427 RepID=UPI001365BB55|nr:RHS repeat domain-containing protein [Solirubrum puertoriconensis]